MFKMEKDKKKYKNFLEYMPIKQQDLVYVSKLNTFIKEKKYKTIKYQNIGKKICDNCGETETPSWRRCPEKKNLLCNACGIYIRIHGKNREKINGVTCLKKKQKLSNENKVCLKCRSKNSYLWRIIGDCVFCDFCFKDEKKN